MDFKKIINISLILITPCFITVEAQAKIYKCVNLNKDVYYNDKPCPVLDIEKEFKAIKDPENGYIPPELVDEQNSKSSRSVVFGKQKNRTIMNNDKDKSDGSKGGNSNSSEGDNYGNVSDNNSRSSDKHNATKKMSAETKARLEKAVKNGSAKRPKRITINIDADHKEPS